MQCVRSVNTAAYPNYMYLPKIQSLISKTHVTLPHVSNENSGAHFVGGKQVQDVDLKMKTLIYLSVNVGFFGNSKEL